ncbi:MAG: hypothetical protein IJV83_01045 [Clostridia bacterium]|nr:hypothetical protein [Clostridia bacterium]
MKKTRTRIFGLAAALALTSSVFAFTGCGEKTSYQGEETREAYEAAMAAGGEVSSNGGFVVEKGDFVYFINGVENTTADNDYGSPVKGALMRIKKSDLTAGNYGEAKIVVPSLFVAQDFNAGVYIYGDYVYYGTPSTDRTIEGDLGNSLIEFKRAKLDGTQAPMDGYYKRLAASTKYRFVQVDGVDKDEDGQDDVFLLYEDGALKSYNTDTDEDTVLVKGAKSAFFYDQSDLANPNVYYTMAVTYQAEEDNPSPLSYDQLYCVNAAASVYEFSASEASYSVADKDGNKVKTYDFNEDAIGSVDSYLDLPYVNLGQLVLDGVGFKSQISHYNNETKEVIETSASEPTGYNYTIKRYASSGENTGLYFTRTPCVSVGNATTSLYYVEDSDTQADVWNTVTANKNLEMVALDATDVRDTSVIVINNENGAREHIYMYVLDSEIKRGSSASVEGKNVITLTRDTSSATLWTVKGNYLYFYEAGVKGKTLSRINYTGNVYDMDIGVEDDYTKITIPFVEYNASWYQPEFVGDYFLYANPQDYASDATEYNYVYAAKIGTTEDLLKAKEDYKAYTDYLAEYDSGDTADEDVEKLIRFLFGAGKDITAEEYAESRAEYIAKFNKGNNDENSTEGEKLLNEILGKFDRTQTEYLKKASDYTNCISRMECDDIEAIDEAWDGLLLYPEEPTVIVIKHTLPAWAIWLIVLGSVAVAAAAVSVPLVLYAKKKKAARLEAEATVNAYKRQRIDTTDDKTIDVYADEEAEVENTEEMQEEVSLEETVESDSETEEKTE